MRQVDVAAPRRPARPRRRMAEQQLAPVRAALLELLRVAEPVQVVLQVLGGHAPEPRQEGAEPRVQRVHRRDAARRAVLRVGRPVRVHPSSAIDAG